MTRPAHAHPPACATAMHVAYSFATARKIVRKPIQQPPAAPLQKPRHCNHHATSRFCFRTAGWLKRTP